MDAHLIELIPRLESAAGPDEELATDIAEALGFQVRRDGGLTRWGRRHPSHAYLSDGHWCASRPIMASVDAALALCERILPGAWWIMAKGRVRAGEPLHAAQLFREGHNPFTSLPLAEAEHETAPIAILIALLHALRASNDRYR